MVGTLNVPSVQAMLRSTHEGGGNTHMTEKTEPFARQLRAWAAHRGMTQTDLFKETQIDRSILSKYWNGKRKPGVGHLTTLAKALKIPVDHLLAGGPLPSGTGQAGPTVQNSTVAASEVSVQSATLPPGLEHFLRGHGDYISSKERQLLSEARFHADPRIVMDDKFWGQILTAIRAGFRHIGSGGGNGPGDPG